VFEWEQRHFFGGGWMCVARHASPGPLSPAEDAVYSFVTTIARGYLGQRARSPVP
jgi:hypothetical protein